MMVEGCDSGDLGGHGGDDKEDADCHIKTAMTMTMILMITVTMAITMLMMTLTLMLTTLMLRLRLMMIIIFIKIIMRRRRVKEPLAHIHRPVKFGSENLPRCPYLISSSIVKAARLPESVNVGALIIRIGFGDILYYHCSKEPHHNSIGSYVSPYIMAPELQADFWSLGFRALSVQRLILYAKMAPPHTSSIHCVWMAVQRAPRDFPCAL